MTTLNFPWPPPQLMPNYKRRNHWRRYYKQARAAEMLGFGLTVQASAKAPEGEFMEYRVAFQPPKRGGPLPDEDNAKAALKHYLDGIARGLRVNDRAFRCKGIEWLPKDGAGSVTISF